MRQAQTLNEAQFCRVLHYRRSRRHPLRDTTIFLASFYAGLRAKRVVIFWQTPCANYFWIYIKPWGSRMLQVIMDDAHTSLNWQI